MEGTSVPGGLVPHTVHIHSPQEDRQKGTEKHLAMDQALRSRAALPLWGPLSFYGFRWMFFITSWHCLEFSLVVGHLQCFFLENSNPETTLRALFTGWQWSSFALERNPGLSSLRGSTMYIPGANSCNEIIARAPPSLFASLCREVCEGRLWGKNPALKPFCCALTARNVCSQGCSCASYQVVIH